MIPIYLQICRRTRWRKREFLVSVTHLKGGELVWTCVKDHIIDEKEDFKEIGLHGLDYKLFEKEEGGGTR